jgi:NAD(P)-dependent dehydrogenase (short-subunit alcohol dehydrogenase family)
MTIQGKRALVTGGSRGIGADIVRQLLDAGAKVLTTARSATATVPTGAAFVEADVRTQEGAEALVRAAEEELGGVDILINNAGAARVFTDGVTAIPDAEWQDSLDVNFLSSVRLNALVLPQMKERRSGSIVHISSVVSFAPAGPMLHYAAAKAALDTYSRGLALDVAPFGITVNSVSPGNITTPGGDRARAEMSVGAGTAPLGRTGVPADVANLVTFLVSERAEWITGQRFTVDGGEFPFR